MKTAVITFPASNCDRDLIETLEHFTGKRPHMIWHADTELPEGLDLIALPGGFSYGDYLRSGAMAARSPIMQQVVKRAKQGALVIGICNGFQILTETGLLPGTLMRNAHLKFNCKTVTLKIENHKTPFTNAYAPNANIKIPIAHHDGNYFADESTLQRLEEQQQIIFTYADENPNGSQRNIAGITNETFNVLGMMPHPERAVDINTGGTDGYGVFKSILNHKVNYA